MENKLILVEGIPGSGKTTTARKIKEKLIAEGKKVVLYEEGMSHPADMSWNAYLSEEEYNNFLSKCLKMWETSEKTISKEELKHRIEIQIRREHNHVILAYTKIDFPEGNYWGLVGEVAAKEICDGRRSLKEFTEIHLRRWESFGEKALLDDNIYIFECAFLQNHIFELLGVYEKSDEAILTYLTNLLNKVKCLNPCIVYIEPVDVEKVIMKAADERKAPNESRKDWIDEIANWVSNTNYGTNHRLAGREGVFSFCKERLRIDKAMIRNLDIPVTLINRD
ncbi:thymidylate kinase [Clostridium folliculivorans]|uniref:Thymidylate kinase-like domain-containing protein n=1 Tax=Clostridium folliculivorans TaxID=2886038 RepID=A0A9W5Y0W5_9CLOT|nr:thymidylate kinase [Clostridium folliculivorans]GKU24477.1 hypothetical protein CFOLD11_13030 [Clostridium folliculivorans]GKU30575.1 hypothetical protein CFB3_26820 [Clostridium folliculivorans]